MVLFMLDNLKKRIVEEKWEDGELVRDRLRCLVLSISGI